MISKKNLIPYFDKIIPGPMPEPDPGWFAREQAYWDANPVAPAPTPSPAPAPAPAPSPTPQVDSYKTGAKGKVIPVGKFGNRLDTEAGRAKESAMMQQEQIDIANRALEVAASEASFGRMESAQEAKQKAVAASNAAISMNKANVSAINKEQNKNLAPSKGLEDFARKVQAFELKAPEVVTKPEEPKPKPEEKKETVIQPSNIRPTPTFRTPDPPKPKVVKNPNRDVVNFSREQFSQSSIARLLFEQVGSIELVNIARRETIEGQNPYYTLISNLSAIRKNFDPTSLISRQKSNRNIEDNYSIDLNSKIPDDEYLDRNNLSDFYYIDDNGDLVIELDNLAPDEIIDFEIAESGTINLVDEA